MRRPLLAQVVPVHATTGLTAIGFRKPRGGESGPQPIWPVKGGSQPTGEPAAPAPAPAAPPAAPAAPPAQPPTPTPSQVFPQNQPPAQVPPAPPATGNGPNGFPEQTPVADMTAVQQAAYWKHQSRKHQGRVESMADYDTLKQQAQELAALQAANMTEHERAVAEAEKRGRAAAVTEFGGTLVEQFMRAALAGRKTDEEIVAMLAPLDKKYFLTADGLSVDTAKVTSFAAVIAPAPATPAAPAPAFPAAAGQAGLPTTTPPAATPPATGATRQVPDMGQGNHTATRVSGLAAGAEIARKRFGTTQKPAQQQ